MYNKRYMIKNILFTILILSIAIFGTYNIYNHFSRLSDKHYNSPSMEIVFHEKEGSKVTIDKVIPVTNSVGLSTDAYTFTIKNNLIEDNHYTIKLIDDVDTINKDSCSDLQIPKELIRVSIKEDNKKNIIYTLSELEDSLLIEDKLEPLEEKEYSIRIWVNNDSTINIGSNLHYHGIIKVGD